MLLIVVCSQVCTAAPHVLVYMTLQTKLRIVIYKIPSEEIVCFVPAVKAIMTRYTGYLIIFIEIFSG